ncbi:hypothetical protein FIBSPDRAFT_883703 [Athelia psychrophila]|uniref:SRCR domain-containing protein n=1 Tax=Athelia psychrophila TaxID=1759441 RepID=A0A166TUI3_9AGAM|nr:hypothetical protein FIBSPDRAFT_883703 [Fibularhizoctonia sp. CBS 109695]
MDDELSLILFLQRMHPQIRALARTTNRLPRILTAGVRPSGPPIPELSGQWINTPPVPGTFVVNIGKVPAEILRLKEHRRTAAATDSVKFTEFDREPSGRVNLIGRVKPRPLNVCTGGLLTLEVADSSTEFLVFRALGQLLVDERIQGVDSSSAAEGVTPVSHRGRRWRSLCGEGCGDGEGAPWGHQSGHSARKACAAV